MLKFIRVGLYTCAYFQELAVPAREDMGLHRKNSQLKLLFYRKGDRSSYEVQLLSGVYLEDEGKGS